MIRAFTKVIPRSEMGLKGDRMFDMVETGGPPSMVDGRTCGRPSTPASPPAAAERPVEGDCANARLAMLTLAGGWYPLPDPP